MTDTLCEDMEKILYKLAEANAITIQNAEILPDHLHLIISFHLKHSASKVVQTLKGGVGKDVV